MCAWVCMCGCIQEMFAHTSACTHIRTHIRTYIRIHVLAHAPLYLFTPALPTSKSSIDSAARNNGLVLGHRNGVCMM